MAHQDLPKIRLLPFILAAIFNPATLVVAAPLTAGTLPTGGQIVAGQGSIAAHGNTMTIHQATDKLIANWETFNIGSAAIVNFLQPSANAVALNRVLSADPSQILGQLSANGQVVLINPAGVVFGASARVDVGGLVATTLSASNGDFLAGKLQFKQAGAAGKVENFGTLVSREGGYVALLGGRVNNAGQIVTPKGSTVLAAGEQVTLNLGLSGLLSVNVTAGSDGARVDNSGLVVADGGNVILTARSASPMLASAVNQTGVIKANTVAHRQGEIWIEAQGGQTTVAGLTQAAGDDAGETGGRIVVTGKDVALNAGAVLDASGVSGGGQALVGGGWQGRDTGIANAQTVRQAQGATVRADATGDGVGGTVVLWSQGATLADGRISARGAGSGAGGRVETSSVGDLGVQGEVDIGAQQGQGGLWLLDPTTLNVSSSGAEPLNQTGASYTNASGTGGTVSVSNTAIQNALNAGGTTVTLQASSAINVNAAISKTQGADSTLVFDTLSAGGSYNGSGSINVNSQISSITGKLNIKFGASSSDSGGTIALNAALATNGGNVDFYKATTLAHTTPISTKITESSASQSGNVTFWRDVTLAAPEYAVTINTQGPQNGGNFTGRGGNIEFKGNIASGAPAGGLPQYPQALTLNTTGADTNTPVNGPGAIILGTAGAGNAVGGAGTAALKSLTLVGPQSVTVNAATLNFFSTSGDVLTASSLLGTPKLLLNATNTTINVRGGTYGSSTGYADYQQTTFDIAKTAGNKTLTINADRSIKIKNRSIDATTTSGKLDVALNPFQASGAVGGAVVLDTVAILSNGGDIGLGSSGTRATGFGGDLEGITNGVYIKNTQLTSAGGNIAIYGSGALTTDAGAAVRIVGALTDINAAAGNLTVDGTQSVFAAAGTKDGVIIGEGGNARSTLRTTTGNIAITGDASGIGSGSGVTGGTRYDGVVVSSRSLIQSGSGNITIVGKGGGGDKSFIDENHGVRLEDTATSIVSTTGNVGVYGASGGKTSATQGSNSFGLYAAGNTMYLGSDESAYSTTTLLLSGAPSASGVITLAADSMNFVNTSTSHLKAASSGELRLHTGAASTNIEMGTAGGVAEAGDPAQRKLYLGSNWFNGSSLGIFQPGFTDIVVGHALSTTSATTTPTVSSSTGTLTVAASTTLRDHTVLELDGTGGRVAVNAALTVQGNGSGGADNARTLTINTQAGATGTGTITAASLQLLGTGDVVLNGANLVNRIAANLGDDLIFKNAQALAVDTVGAQDRSATSGATSWMGGSQQATVGITTSNDNASLLTSTGDLTLRQNVTVGTATTSLVSDQGSVTEVNSARVSSGYLYVGARTDALLRNINTVGNIAAVVRQGALEFRNQGNLTINSFTTTDALALSSGTQDSTRAGLSASSRVALNVINGDLAQNLNTSLATDITTPTLQIVMSNQGGAQLGLVNLGRVTNDVDTLGMDADVTHVIFRDKDDLTLGATTSTMGASGASLGVNGLRTSNADATIVASANGATANANLVIAESVSVGTGTADLSSGQGAITETGTATVTADKLRLTAVNTSLLNNANAVNQIAASISGDSQGLDFTNVQNLTVADVAAGTGSGGGTLSGITAGSSIARGVVSIDTRGASTSGDVSGTSPIIANKLLLRTNGVVNLVGGLHNINTLAANTNGHTLRYTDADDLSIGTVDRNADGTGTTSGITAGTAASATTVALTSVAGAISQTSVAPITGGSLVVRAVNGVTLDNTSNDVAVLAGRVSGTGPFVYADANQLDVGSGGDANQATVDGVQTGNGLIRISASKASNATSGDLNLTQDVVAGGGSTLTLEAIKGAVTETSNVDITASSLLINAQDSTSLSNTGSGGKHLIGTLAARLTGTGASFMFRNDQALTIGALTAQDANTATEGIRTASGDVHVATLTGNLIITKDVSAGNNGSVDLRAGTTSNLAINGATVASRGSAGVGSGTVQLVAGGNIATNTANSTSTIQPEVQTTGDVLLQAGGTIGADGQRIELQDASTVATQAGGATWLRQITGTTRDTLTVGAVTALHSGDTFGASVANRAGLVTTANNGSISLNNAAGGLIIGQGITAHGSGTVDLRTGGIGKAIAIQGVTVASTSGQVQLVASGEISTNSANGAVTEIATQGNVLLVAGGAIGADGYRIELNGASTLAAESVGEQWLRQRNGALVIGDVAAITPTDNAIDRAVASKSGLLTTGGNASIAIGTGSGDLIVNRDIVAHGNGIVDVRAKGGAVNISGGTLKSGDGTGTGTIQVVAEGDIMTSTANGTTTEIATAGDVLLMAGGQIGDAGYRIETAGVRTLAAQSGQAQWLRQTQGNLTLGAVAAFLPGDNGLDVAAYGLSGLSTLTNDAAVSLNLGSGNLTLSSDVVAAGNGNVDLRAATGDIVFDGAGVRSGSVGAGTGTVQLLAGGAIRTTTPNGTVTEVATQGHALLVAGGAIGADGQRIELAGVQRLATESGASQWLRHVSGNSLTLGSVSALTPTDNAIDLAASSKQGLVTTANNGSIALNVVSGDLLIAQGVVTHGSGNVDLRVKQGNLSLQNGGIVAGGDGTGTGKVQLMAGGDIATSDATTTAQDGALTEVATAGQVVLVAGGHIGGEGQRIELSRVTGLATASGGDQWLSQTQGGLTVAAVSALSPTDNAIDVSAVNRAGLTATNAAANVSLRTRTGAIQLDQGITTTAGIVSLVSAAGVGQAGTSGAAIAADQLRIVAAQGQAVLDNASNTVSKVAAQVTGGDAVVVSNAALTVGTVATGSGSGNDAGQTAGVGTTTGGRHITLKTLTGSLTLDANVATTADNTHADVLTLASAAGISQNTGAVTASQARVLTQAGSATLTGSTNAVGTLAASVQGGNLSYVNNAALSLGQVTTATTAAAGSTQGVSGSGNVNVSTLQGALTVDQALAATGNLTLGSAAALTVNRSLTAANATLTAGTSLAQGDGQIDVGTGTLTLTAQAGGVNQTGTGAITAGQLAVDATGASSLTHAQNRIATLAARTTGTGSHLAVRNATDLTIGTVGSLQGIVSAGTVDVQVPQHTLTVARAVSGVGTGPDSNAVVLRAGGRFFNEVGVNGVTASNGRWLIYDDNPFLLNPELNGLARDFVLVRTRYDDYPPATLVERGNGYITTADYVPTEDASSAARASLMGSVAYGGALPGSVVSGAPTSPDVQLVIGQPFRPTTTAIPVQVLADATQAPDEPLLVPVLLTVKPGTHFQSSLSFLQGHGDVVAVTQADGQPLPAWVNVDLAGGKVFGTTPGGASRELPLLVQVKERDSGKTRRFNLKLQVSQAQ